MEGIMFEHAEPMSCGECGEKNHRLYLVGETIVTECIQCKSKSIITVTKPELDIQCDEDSPGTICVLPGDKND
jgi:hypothetical protein